MKVHLYTEAQLNILEITSELIGKHFHRKKISESLGLFSDYFCTLITTCSLSLAQELVTLPYEE